jgi:hypothetical protein
MFVICSYVMASIDNYLIKIFQCKGEGGRKGDINDHNYLLTYLLTPWSRVPS